MKQIIIRQGAAVVEEVPAPLVEPGAVLVCVHHSCISVGTEMAGVRDSGTPLWKRALQQPEKIKRVATMIRDEGLGKTSRLVKSKVAAGYPTGYSAAGTVVAVGDGVHDLQVGDTVACAGAQFAHHAEFILVPRNLVAPVPDGVGTLEASTVTLGAIAMQGVRRALPTLGESFVVMGLGILGQLTVQLLRANGCQVIVSDVDRSRIRLALETGAHHGIHPEEHGDTAAAVMRLTDGYGADGVIITAAGSSHEIIASAFAMCRKKGRVVLVGDVGLNLNRNDMYVKELDFLISTSYGPGRYDRTYEEEGLDYPISHVRWTENRNMGACLTLLQQGALRLEKLLTDITPLEQADAAYRRLQGAAGDKPLVALLSYPAASGAAPAPATRVELVRAAAGQPLAVGLVGAGGYATAVHLPNLAAMPEQGHLRAVASRRGHNTAETARHFQAAYATTDPAELFADPQLQAVIIATRHHLHVEQTLAALAAGKHVLVEKPLALTDPDLARIQAFFATGAGGQPLLMTGFNRRFSPIARRIAELTAHRTSPMIINYRMNAGYIPLDHWVHGPEGGGRNRGEACHIYDLFTFLCGSRVASVSAKAIHPAGGYYSHQDNFVATMAFADGSVASLTYTALGSNAHPKERMEVFVDGQVLVMDDFRQLRVDGAPHKGIEGRVQDKGQKAALAAFLQAARQGGAWPIPLWQQVQATEIANRVEAILQGE